MVQFCNRRRKSHFLTHPVDNFKQVQKILKHGISNFKNNFILISRQITYFNLFTRTKNIECPDKIKV